MKHLSLLLLVAVLNADKTRVGLFYEPDFIDRNDKKSIQLEIKWDLGKNFELRFEHELYKKSKQKQYFNESKVGINYYF